MRRKALYEKKIRYVVTLVVTLMVLSGAAFASGGSESSDISEPIFDVPSTPVADTSQGIGTLIEMQNSFRAVAQKVLPVVVEVDTVDIVTQSTTGQSSPFSFFFGPRNQEDSSTPREFRRSGLGSGVIVYRSNGDVYVLTNHHVAGGAEEITITLYDGRKFEASLVGSDEKRDLSLVRFKTKEEIPVAELGDSNNVMVGDWALAIGNPYGFESSVTAGIVSAIGRETSGAGGGDVAYTDYIQTDAAINQGNSGGALVNIYGQVVGINTWIASPSGGNIGIGFAIPINNARKVVEDLIRNGEIQYGWLGITVGDVTRSIREDLGLSDAKGGFVFGVIDNSPAEKAGILAGDLITGIGNEEIEGRDDLIITVANLAPGTELGFDISRGGESVETTVTIAVRDDERIDSGKDKIWPGFFLVNVTDDIRERLATTKDAGNVVVGSVDEGSSAAEVGLRSGDIVSTINGVELEDVSDFYEIINDPDTKKFELTINRRGETLDMEFQR